MAFLDYLTDVKPVLGIPDAQDDLVARLTVSACEYIERLTGLTLSVRTVTIQPPLSPDSRGLIASPLVPLRSASQGGQDLEKVGPYRFRPRSTTEAVTVVGGIPCPAPLRQATLELIAYNRQRWLQKAFGVSARGMDNVQVTYDFEIPLAVQRVVDRYREVAL